MTAERRLRQVRDVGGFIRNQREVASMSVRRLADLAGVSNPYVSQIERGLRRPSAEVLRQLANALQISVESLFAEAGLPTGDAAAAGRGVREAIAADTHLTADQKQALLKVYESFLSANPDHA